MNSLPSPIVLGHRGDRNKHSEDPKETLNAQRIEVGKEESLYQGSNMNVGSL